jgi:hypothetical protein
MFTGNVAAFSQIKRDTLGNRVIYERDERLDLMFIKREELNKKFLLSIEVPTKGYRVQAMSTSDRAKALDAKSRILTTFPQYRVYLLYQAPYFKIRVGNFIEKKDADELRKELLRIFSAGVITVNSEIELSKKEKEDFINKLAEQEKEGKVPPKKKN